MLRAVPLSVQLVITFVGLIVGTTAALTAAAHTFSRVSLEAEARRNVSLATATREQSLTQLFNLRQQRAEGLLASMQSLCGEPLSAGRLAWAPDCVQTLVNDFRASERAEGVLLTYRNRRISRSGATISPARPPATRWRHRQALRWGDRIRDTATLDGAASRRSSATRKSGRCSRAAAASDRPASCSCRW